MSKPTITAEALAMARDHPLAESEQFLIALSENLARLHHTATGADRIAVLNKATAEHTKQADAQEIATARTEAALAERARIASILTSQEASGRETVAQALAFQSDMPATAAIEALKTAPKSSPLAGWGATAPTEPKPLTPELEAALRARAAGQGVQTVDGEFVSVANEPAPPRTAADPVKSMWKETIAGINRETGGATAAK